ncbi:hypothetical protein FNF31_03929 [Cafeteria roenbergensis]|uniref:Uncharacterized protein n=1 Tax=Cafeteria roenbergensis TaxID=33653 RepID=A0A5A8D7U3_CAFRO|nr:hypothetical protein FNF31_03929 [Cafeteria roenbergensis]
MLSAAALGSYDRIDEQLRDLAEVQQVESALLRAAVAQKDVEVAGGLGSVAFALSEPVDAESIRAWSRLDIDFPSHLAPGSTARALARRGEWTAALMASWSAVASTRDQVLRMLAESQRDLLFWRQRSHAPLQELIEQGPWGWLHAARGHRAVAPSDHAASLAMHMSPLFVVVGAATRARDLVSGTLDYCAARSSAAAAAGAETSALDELFTATASNRPPSVLVATASDEVNLPGGAAQAGPAGGVGTSVLFTHRGRPVRATVTLLGVLAAGLRAILATLAAAPSASSEARLQAAALLRRWTSVPVIQDPKLAARLVSEGVQRVGVLLGDIRAGLAPHRRRWGPLRNWHRIALASAVGAVAAGALWRQRESLGAFTTGIAESVGQFASAHLIEPARDMLRELLSNRKLEIADADSLGATRDSLVEVLFQYYAANPEVLVAAGKLPKATQPLDPKVVAAAARACADTQDIGPAEMRFAHEMQSPLVSAVAGTLPQLMLLQMSKLRVEALTLMHAMDGVIKSNDFTASMAAVMPFVAVVMGAGWLLRVFARAAFQTVPTDELKHSIILCVRDIDRLLALAATSGRPERTPNMSSDEDFEPLSPAMSVRRPGGMEVGSGRSSPRSPAVAGAAAAALSTPMMLASSAALAARRIRRVSSIGGVGAGHASAHPFSAPDGASHSTEDRQLSALLESEEDTGAGVGASGGLATSGQALAQRPHSPGSSNGGTVVPCGLEGLGRTLESAGEEGGLAPADGSDHRHPPQTPARGERQTQPPPTLHVDTTLASQELAELQGGLERLSLLDLGSLELRLVRLRELIRQLAVFLHEEEVARLDEDLADLSADDLAAPARRGILQRMRHTYSFLTPVARDEALTSLFGIRVLG